MATQEELIYQLLVQIDVRAQQATEKLAELERRVQGTQGALEGGLQRRPGGAADFEFDGRGSWWLQARLAQYL